MMHRILGALLLFSCMVCVFYFEGHSNAEGFMRIFHWPAIVLTGAGPIAMILISYDWPVLVRAFTMTFTEAPGSVQKTLYREAMVLHKIGQNYYEAGPAAFENLKIKNISDFVRRMIERLAVRVPVTDIADMLYKERERAVIRNVQCLNVIALGIKLAPSLGMLGTILGMVNLLSTLEDPSKIGPAMSLALLTTFYGLFFSIVVWTPIQQKAERVFDLRLETYDQAGRWIEMLEKRKPIAYFAETSGVPQAPQQKAAG